MAAMVGPAALSLRTRCCGFSETRDTLREAFRQELIHAGESWTLMIQDRNLTSHTYQRNRRCDCRQYSAALSQLLSKPVHSPAADPLGARGTLMDATSSEKAQTVVIPGISWP